MLWKFSSLAEPSIPDTKCGMKLNPRELKPLKEAKGGEEYCPFEKGQGCGWPRGHHGLRHIR